MFRHAGVAPSFSLPWGDIPAHHQQPWPEAVAFCARVKHKTAMIDIDISVRLKSAALDDVHDASPKRKAFRNLLASFLLLLFFSSLVYSQEQSSAIQIYFFYSKDSQSSQAILETYLPSLQSDFPFLEVKTFDLGKPSNYEALTALEKKFNRRAESLPAVFIGEHLLSGEMEVMEKLNPLILEYQMKGGASLPPIEVGNSVPISADSNKIDLAYFYQKGCPKCDRANSLLNYLMKRHPHLNVRSIDLNTADGKRLNETLSNRLHLPETYRLIAPSIFVGDDYLPPESIMESKVEELLQKYEKSGAKSPLDLEAGEVGRAEQTIIERFKSLGIFAILAAGAIEGLNPCAFATLIFFISYLAMVGRRREEIFAVGICFSSGSGFSVLFDTFLSCPCSAGSFTQSPFSYHSGSAG
jgi:thiol-disulfide isomerase/thioredoxin